MEKIWQDFSYVEEEFIAIIWGNKIVFSPRILFITVIFWRKKLTFPNQCQFAVRVVYQKSLCASA